MGVFFNKAFDDGSVVALWRFTEGEGKSLSEQRLAVDALIDSVFDGQFRLCHNDEGVPALEVVDEPNVAVGVKPSNRDAAASRVTESGEPLVPFVSISHTRGWAVAMTSPKEHVGIDIELTDRNFSVVEKKSLCPAELSRLDSWTEVLGDSLPPDTNADPPETASVINPRNTVLGLLWCAKEAVYKRLTVPAPDFADQIEIEDIVPASTINSKEEPERLCDPPIEGKITAIFKHGNDGTTKIHLNYTLLPSLILVHTID